VNVASSPETSLITSLILAATAAAPRTSLPTVTRCTRPAYRRRTRWSAHTIWAKVVFPNPPAPYSPVVIPTVPVPPSTSALTTAAISAGRSTTQSGTSSSGGNNAFGGLGKAQTATTTATTAVGAANIAAHKLAWTRP